MNINLIAKLSKTTSTFCFLLTHSVILGTDTPSKPQSSNLFYVPGPKKVNKFQVDKKLIIPMFSSFLTIIFMMVPEQSTNTF